MKNKNTNKPIVAELNILSLVFLIVLIIFAIFATLDMVYPPKCTEYKTISSILQVDGRSVSVQFTDGSTTTMYQPIVKPGKVICTKVE